MGMPQAESENGHLKVILDERPLCEVSEIGGIRYREEYVETTERVAEKDKVYGVVRTTAEYMRQMEHARFTFFGKRKCLLPVKRTDFLVKNSVCKHFH